MPPAKPACALVLAALVALAGCGSSKDLKRYKGKAFDVGKPSSAWTLVADRRHFTLAEPPSAAVAGAKAVEFVNRDLRASAEIFVVEGGATEVERVMKAVLRQDRRRGIVEGKGKPFTVGGTEGLATIALWRQTKTSPKQCFYCVRVPLGARLWCFIGSASQTRFETAKQEFKAILKTVRFHG